MGNIPYLLMLFMFALVLYWYLLNEYRGKDGLDGLLGLRKDEIYDPVDDEDLIEEAPLDPRERIKTRAASARGGNPLDGKDEPPRYDGY